MLSKASRYQCCWSFPSREVSVYSAGEFCHSDGIYFVHALVIDIANACTREEVTASSASLLAMPLQFIVGI